MKFYTINDNKILIAENKDILERFYQDVKLLPEDYQEGKYYVKDNELVRNEHWEEEELIKTKQSKYQEANSKANTYLQSGEALFEFEPDKHIEATDGNIAKMNAYLTGLQAGAFEEVVWVSKEDEILTLNAEDVTTILLGLGQVQADIWSNQFLAYKNAIDEATTVEEVESIEVSYHS